MNLNCSACRDGHNTQIPRAIAQRGELKRDLLLLRRTSDLLQGAAIGCRFPLGANGAKGLNGLSVANVGFQMAEKHDFHATSLQPCMRGAPNVLSAARAIALRSRDPSLAQ